ncbi:LOW QUALITY PROTEIN: pentatricopeptide repeat-containing protein 1, mitochondrial [Trematomus bernacchii]|uniref:LOW QUALITY PROTEIN: pentatricopeptide repeat-containing protein 1, mitochondrial n=1 Tax=Trematomus bernacchii TaxID=40690 RepID=UPI00146A1C96|nr:LOW QUALITY PROTEIN: pentatricopeptide repeat-containing protein 1, mitochondrial [Trematomus bernacchii]
MLTSVACSCMRNGKRVSARLAKLSPFLTESSSTQTVNLKGGHWSSGLLSPAPWQLQSARSVSLSAASHGATKPLDSPLVPAEDDPPEREKFGAFSADISSRRSFRKTSPDLQDLKHQEAEVGKPYPRTARKNTPYWYFLECKKLIEVNKLQEAIDLFSGNMLKGEMLQPEQYNYTILIGGCGRAGQLKMAFRLYNDMKKRGLVPNDATYTALFNACAETPYKETGLQHALKLEQELRRLNVPLNTMTYHALLKTHAISNNLQACIQTIREMLQNRHVVTQETFHYLLMGCLKDKETGFRLALQVWRQMLRSGLLPDTYNYNLLLRTARDCGIGDPAQTSAVLLKPDQGYEGKRLSKLQSSEKVLLNIDLLEKQLCFQPDARSDSQQDGRGSEEESNIKQDSSHLVPVRQIETSPLPVDLVADSTAPNLLDLFEGKRVAVVSLGTVAGAADRLALIGGAKGFLEKMKAKSLSPNLKTLALLADTMEPGYESLQMLLRVAKEHKVKLDVAFFNSVIRRSARTGDLEEAKGVLSVMRQRNVSVDVQTFGSLALGCEQQEDGLQLLKDMEVAGFKPNVQVFSALIGRASRRLDFLYLKTLLKSMTSIGVAPNKVIIKQLEFASEYPPDYDQYKSRNNYLVRIEGFRGFYQQWLRFMPGQSAEEELQPEAEDEEPNTDAAGGLTKGQSNQKAAARRYGSRNKDKTDSGAL